MLKCKFRNNQCEVSFLIDNFKKTFFSVENNQWGNNISQEPMIIYLLFICQSERHISSKSTTSNAFDFILIKLSITMLSKI